MKSRFVPSAARRFALLLSTSVLMLLSCREAGRPLVGITCSRTESGSDRLSSSYSEAIRRAGGIPLIIPTVAERSEAEAILERLDGIIFSGGEDVNPAWYGEEILNETVEVNPVRDRSDSLLGRAALDSGKPILAICRGEQLLNVLLGGSLYQDIPSQLPEAHTHRGVKHMVALEKGGFLETLFGTDSLLVNSSHHQAVKVLSPGARKAATSDGGVIEAWENGQVLAVQFHPEGLVREDDKWLSLFSCFVSSCRD